MSLIAARNLSKIYASDSVKINALQDVTFQRGPGAAKGGGPSIGN
jgi:hypothetical protein